MALIEFARAKKFPNKETSIRNVQEINRLWIGYQSLLDQSGRTVKREGFLGMGGSESIRFSKILHENGEKPIQVSITQNPQYRGSLSIFIEGITDYMVIGEGVMQIRFNTGTEYGFNFKKANSRDIKDYSEILALLQK